MIIENSIPFEVSTDVLVKAFLKILLNDGLINNKTYFTVGYWFYCNICSVH